MDLQALAQAATIATGVSAIAALGFAVVQIRAFRNSQIEATAREQYQAFLRHCIEYPELAREQGQNLDCAAGTLNGSKKQFCGTNGSSPRA